MNDYKVIHKDAYYYKKKIFLKNAISTVLFFEEKVSQKYKKKFSSNASMIS